jgi:hypothetical protein
MEISTERNRKLYFITSQKMNWLKTSFCAAFGRIYSANHDISYVWNLGIMSSN